MGCITMPHWLGVSLLQCACWPLADQAFPAKMWIKLIQKFSPINRLNYQKQSSFFGPPDTDKFCFIIINFLRSHVEITTERFIIQSGTGVFKSFIKKFLQYFNGDINSNNFNRLKRDILKYELNYAFITFQSSDE